jgi:hybrid polyketide synthase / nonribosomal peptide synthetase ACE1
MTDLHTIKPQTDFFHVGGTSLLLLDLRQRIQTRFQIEFPIIDMFNASTLQRTVQVIETENTHNLPVADIN